MTSKIVDCKLLQELSIGKCEQYWNLQNITEEANGQQFWWEFLRGCNKYNEMAPKEESHYLENN